VMTVSDPDGSKALRLNGAIGELTHFDDTYGYYAEGVEDGLFRFPDGWRERLIPIESPATNGVTGLCAEPHDLCASKLLAGRDKDLKYVASLLRSGHVKVEVLFERVQTLMRQPMNFNESSVSWNAQQDRRRTHQPDEVSEKPRSTLSR
jgi:hypothetical protein